MITNKIICGAMPEATKGFPDGHFNCSISSPPYWALRDYGVDGQLGLEPTFEEYIDKLCDIYDEVKRVLRKDGTCWVNLGDTYNANYRGGGVETASKFQAASKGTIPFMGKSAPDRCGIPAKSLCLIPQRFAIEMVNRGWILRNVIIWHKPNPMPSSAKDRFTVDFEYVYFFVKSKKYWFEPQYEPLSDPERQNFQSGKRTFGENKDRNDNDLGIRSKDYSFPLGRNKRTVWTIPTQPFPEAHFATFPEKLVEPMIRSGCPEFVCTKCGKAREKIYDTQSHYTKRENAYAPNNEPTKVDSTGWERPTINFKGYTDCGCNADWRPGIVLDCFCRLWHDFTGSCKAAA